ncbi:protein of unknown function [Oscillibacter sp. PC13]|uniref:DUF3298 and DUF4163 domain-containing protein n=1 Tax=Oscillibacter sp. PC13 TaxID=1855299 RepID=UPI0008E39EB2|nr:DUF3298 and DUF4163 domain-containing protein [Oscillibacter sp. PC13]SFP70574.1 protein of unknown function [Oscillibacter sp. PC13]
MTTFIALLLAVSMLSGCSNASVTNIKSTPAEFSVSAILAEAKPEAVTYTVELQTVENTAEAEDGTLLVHYKFELPVMTAVRKDGSEILQAANETERAALLIVESFNSQFADWLDRGEFSALAAAAEEDRTWQVLNGGEWIGAYELGLTCDLYQTGELISVAAEYYSYTGGAHPNTSLLAWNFDLTTGQFFTPAILAADGQDFLAAVQEEIVRQANIPLEDGTVPAAGYWEDYEEIAADWSSYAVSFDETGMKVAFSPYEIACYAAGPQVFSLPYELLLPHLSDHGKVILELGTTED